VAGAGKTAPLDYAVAVGPALFNMRAVGVECEMELPFAALHQIFMPGSTGWSGSRGPQRDALRVVFGLSAGGGSDRFLVGLAALGLISVSPTIDRCSA
jgi:hypothetical protein